MGCVSTSHKPPQEETTLGLDSIPNEQRHKEIEDQIRQDQLSQNATRKLLLLGNSDSGKSTLVKQMKILHSDGFTDVELANYRHLIYRNIAEATESLYSSAEVLKIYFDPATQAKVTTFLQLIKEESYFNVPILELAQEIWESSEIQLSFAQRHALQLCDNVQYYMSHLHRIAKDDFVPTQMDILFCRAHTSGVYCTEFRQRNRQIRLIDVGGQKSERRKWIHCFDDVTAILFVAALSGYDEVLEEKPTENRMLDGLSLFDATCESEYFVDTAIVLFLNKMDVFEEKIKHVPLNACFTEYTGENDFENASEYIRRQFTEENEANGRHIYSHFTNATNTTNIDNVFSSVIDIVVNHRMGNSGVE